MSGTGIEIVTNLPTCRVQVLRRIELIDVPGTGIEFVPNLTGVYGRSLRPYRTIPRSLVGYLQIPPVHLGTVSMPYRAHPCKVMPVLGMFNSVCPRQGLVCALALYDMIWYRKRPAYVRVSTQRNVQPDVDCAGGFSRKKTYAVVGDLPGSSARVGGVSCYAVIPDT